MTRPILIDVLSAILEVASLIAVTVGVALLFPGTVLDSMWQYNEPAHAAFLVARRTTGIGFLLLAAVLASAGVGFIRRRAWAWLTAIAIFRLNGLGDKVGLIMHRDPIRSAAGLFIAAAFVTLLFTRRVRTFFTRPAPRRHDQPHASLDRKL